MITLSLHKLVLYAALGFAGFSLAIPGVLEVLGWSNAGNSPLEAKSVSARSHLRGLNAMMAAIGALALWACLDLTQSRRLVIALGVVFAAVALARLYGIVVDGLPDQRTAIYLAVEITLAVLFLLWPPAP